MDDNYISMARTLPKRLANSTVEGITDHETFQPVRDYISNLEANLRRGLGLFLCGPNGAGKSGALAAVYKEVRTKFPRLGSRNIIWARARDIALSYGYFKTDETFDEPVDEVYNTAKFLVLDELGRESDLKNSERRLHHLLGVRRDNVRCTSFTSNLTFPAVVERYGPGVESLIKETCYVVQVDGIDRRNY